MKLLAVGDLHLGRRPARLPPALRGRSDARTLGPAGAWERLIEAAITERVDAVALAGDVVEREEDFFEAYRDLHQGVLRLAEAGIRVLGVAGNHDWKVLPRLAAQIPEFQLLGAKGEWASGTMEADGESVTLWGRSFTARWVREDPLDGVTFNCKSGVNLGLLHCDLDQRDSAYAPVSSNRLEAAGLDGWLLGHIHIPSALSAPDPSGYLGSVTGLDPGETGDRGPWLIEISGGRVQKVSQWTLAPLRWQALEVDLAGISDPGDARERLLQALIALDETIAGARWTPLAAGLRVRFVGRTRFGAAVAGLFSEEDRGQIHTGKKQTSYFIERIENAAAPEIALEELAARDDPPGLLARRLLLLDRAGDDPERRELLRNARESFHKRVRDSRWTALSKETLDDAVTEDYLRRAGVAALEKLLQQREATA